MLTVQTFPTDDGAIWITGNRCDNGRDRILAERAASSLSSSSPSSPTQPNQQRLPTTNNHKKKNSEVYNGFEWKLKRLFASSSSSVPPPFPSLSSSLLRDRHGIAIGLPRALNFFDETPFWSAFFRALQFKIFFSSPSTSSKYEKSVCTIPSGVSPVVVVRCVLVFDSLFFVEVDEADEEEDVVVSHHVCYSLCSCCHSLVLIRYCLLSCETATWSRHGVDRSRRSLHFLPHGNEESERVQERLV